MSYNPHHGRGGRGGQGYNPTSAGPGRGNYAQNHSRNSNQGGTNRNHQQRHGYHNSNGWNGKSGEGKPNGRLDAPNMTQLLEADRGPAAGIVNKKDQQRQEQASDKPPNDQQKEVKKNVQSPRILCQCLDVSMVPMIGGTYVFVESGYELAGNRGGIETEARDTLTGPYGKWHKVGFVQDVLGRVSEFLVQVELTQQFGVQDFPKGTKLWVDTANYVQSMRAFDPKPQYEKKLDPMYGGRKRPSRKQKKPDEASDRDKVTKGGGGGSANKNQPRTNNGPAYYNKSQSRGGQPWNNGNPQNTNYRGGSYGRGGNNYRGGASYGGGGNNYRGGASYGGAGNNYRGGASYGGAGNNYRGGASYGGGASYPRGGGGGWYSDRGQ